jgi:hypothetical protein
VDYKGKNYDLKDAANILTFNAAKKAFNDELRNELATLEPTLATAFKDDVIDK